MNRSKQPGSVLYRTGLQRIKKAFLIRGYAFRGSFLGGGERVKQKNLWLQDEATSYGKTFFNR